jgi:hypothetical protein
MAAGIRVYRGSATTSSLLHSTVISERLRVNVSKRLHERGNQRQHGEETFAHR